MILRKIKDKNKKGSIAIEKLLILILVLVAVVLGIWGLVHYDIISKIGIVIPTFGDEPNAGTGTGTTGTTSAVKLQCNFVIGMVGNTKDVPIVFIDMFTKIPSNSKIAINENIVQVGDGFFGTETIGSVDSATKVITLDKEIMAQVGEKYSRIEKNLPTNFNYIENLNGAFISDNRICREKLIPPKTNPSKWKVVGEISTPYLFRSQLLIQEDPEKIPLKLSDFGIKLSGSTLYVTGTLQLNKLFTKGTISDIKANAENIMLGIIIDNKIWIYDNVYQRDVSINSKIDEYNRNQIAKGLPTLQEKLMGAQIQGKRVLSVN